MKNKGDLVKNNTQKEDFSFISSENKKVKKFDQDSNVEKENMDADEFEKHAGEKKEL